MTPVLAPDGRRLLYDWAHDDRRRLALWIVAAIILHAGGYLLFRVQYPRPEPARISDATLYILLPDSAEARRLAPFLASADPALFAPERSPALDLPTPGIPAYEPSYAAAPPGLASLPDSPSRILPPLPRDFGPVPMAETAPDLASLPAPAERTQIHFSESLRQRPPAAWPKLKLVARPGDQLSPARFLLAVAPDGRVLHVLREEGSRNAALDDAASRLLMQGWFARGAGTDISWGTATFHWGLDVEREELR